MGKVYDEIDPKLARWLGDQPVFFVGTAPSGRDGHVNVSPKGMAGTFAVLGPHQVGYLDYFGSGVETIAHLKDNGRIVIMCCAFDGPPKVVRLHGRGRVVLPGDPAYPYLRTRFGKQRDCGARSIIVVDVERISDSCGYAVPTMQFVQDRDVLDLHQQRRPPEFFEQYALERNSVSIDGLPGLPPA
jgi:pyridoxamine 5'-phosphate oxidase-like protein